MSKQHQLFVKQAAILVFAGLLVRVIGFIYRLPLTNMIGDEGNGIYGAGYNLYIFFLIMSSAGLPAAISKMVSHRFALKQYENAHRIFRVALITAATAGLVCSLLLWFGASFLADLVNSPRSVHAILTLAPTLLIVSIMAVFRGYFQGMNNTLPTAISQIVEQVFNAIFSVLLAFVLLRQTQDLALGAAGGTAGTGVGAMAGLLTIMAVYMKMSPQFKKQRLEDDGAAPQERHVTLLAELVKTTVPIIIGTAIFSITNLIDMAMVNTLLLQSGYAQVEVDRMYGMLTGKYVTLTTLPVTISTAIATASVPNIARSIAINDKAGANRKINLALRLTMMVSVPAAVGIGVLAGPILLMLFPDFPDGEYLLQIGALSIIFLALTQIVTGMLQGSGYVQVPAIAAFFGALVKIPLNYLLIPLDYIVVFGFAFEMNVAGAVISTTACYAVASAINLVVLKRIMGKGARLDLVSGFGKPLAAATAMGVFCFASYRLFYMLLSSNTLACLIAIAIGMGVYFGCMVKTKGIVRDDVIMMPFGKKIVKIWDRFA